MLRSKGREEKVGGNIWGKSILYKGVGKCTWTWGKNKLGMVQGTASGVGGVGKKAGERSRQGQFMWVRQVMVRNLGSEYIGKSLVLSREVKYHDKLLKSSHCVDI